MRRANGIRPTVFLTLFACFALGVTGGTNEAKAQETDVASPHPVVDRLVTKGLQLQQDAVVKLTPPLITPAMTADEQRSALEKLMGRRKFVNAMSQSVSADQELRVATERTLGARGAIRRLDQYFVAYADFELMKDEALLKDFMGQEKKERGPEKFEHYLERLEQGAKGEADASKPYVYRMRMGLLDKVMISGLIRGQSYSGPGLLIESALSPEDLLNDPDDPTVWQAIPRGARGDSDLGPKTPYRGLAGYLQVCELKFQEGALLVECHAVLVEPNGWFGGRNLLQSKLPLVAHNNMRSFRRKLAAAMEEFEKRKQ